MQSADIGRGVIGDEYTCLGTHTVPKATDGVAATAKVTVFDVAGNATELGKISFEFANAAVGGCELAGGGPSERSDDGCTVRRVHGDTHPAWMALLALVVLARRKRR
jgi:MYXO-CTERM domain-containing protein